MRTSTLHPKPAVLRNDLIGWISLSWLALACPLSALAQAAAMTAVEKAVENVTLNYPKPESDADLRGRYALDLLRLVISKQGMSHVRLQASELAMPQQRVLKELESGQTLDIAWTMTSAERERNLLPIRIPIDRGLLGWRLALLPADKAEALAGVSDLQALRTRVAGQGHDWPDTQILRHSGITVSTLGNYEGLFKMLSLHRFDYFPRSVMEIWQELDSLPGASLTVDRHVLIRYPAALYFFVNPNNKQLARQLSEGLETSLRDGSFDCLFERHFGALLRRAELGRRQTIELPNPLLPRATPLERKELWFQLPDKNKPGAKAAPKPANCH